VRLLFGSRSVTPETQSSRVTSPLTESNVSKSKSPLMSPFHESKLAGMKRNVEERHSEPATMTDHRDDNGISADNIIDRFVGCSVPGSTGSVYADRGEVLSGYEADDEADDEDDGHNVNNRIVVRASFVLRAATWNRPDREHDKGGDFDQPLDRTATWDDPDHFNGILINGSNDGEEESNSVEAED
jgi:hypothetical protein